MKNTRAFTSRTRDGFPALVPLPPLGGYRGLFVIIAILMMTSCRSSKKENGDSTSSTTAQVGTRANDQEIVASVLESRQNVQGLRSKVSVRLAYGGKTASASGQLKMKRDEIVQVSITALGIMELGRLELTPQHLLVLDRVNNQYLQVAWSDVPELAQAGVDFTTFQALFWNELFVPGISGIPTASDFDVERQSGQLLLQPKATRANTKKLAVNFLVSTASALVEKTNVTPTDGRRKMSFQCAYADWNTLAGKKFPKSMNLNVRDGNNSYALTLTSSSLQADESMGNLTTRIPSGYRQVTLDQIMRMLAQ